MNELGNTPADKNYKPNGIISEEYPEKVKVAYLQGYEQAEKDLALTWKDMRKIIRIDLEMIDDPEAHPEWMEEQPFYEEMLRRFMQIKEAKK